MAPPVAAEPPAAAAVPASATPPLAGVIPAGSTEAAEPLFLPRRRTLLPAEPPELPASALGSAAALDPRPLPGSGNGESGEHA